MSNLTKMYWFIISPFAKLHENGDCHFSKLGEYESLTQLLKIFVMRNISPLFFSVRFSIGGNFSSLLSDVDSW